MKERINVRKIQTSGRILFYIVSFLVLVPPLSLWNSVLFTKYDIYFRLIVIAIIGVQFLKDYWDNKTIDIWVLLFSCFCFLTVVSTYLNAGDLKQALWGNTIVPLSILLLVRNGIIREEKLFVLSLFFLYFVLGIFNFASVIQNFQYLDRADYFYCNRNMHIFYYMISLFCGYYAVQKGHLQRKIWSLFLGICLISTILTRGLISSVIMALWCIYLIPTVSRLLCKRKTMLIGYVINLVILSAIIFLCLNKVGLIDGLFKLIGKGESFAARKYIWTTVLEMIKNKPIFGYGICDTLETIGYRHAHNIYLQVLYVRGVCGFGVFCGMVLVLDGQIKAHLNSNGISVMGMVLFCLLLAGQGEVGYIYFYVLFGSLFYYLCKLNENKSNI